MRFWWSALSAIAIFNIVLWSLSARALAKTRGARSSKEHDWWRRQSMLSAVFVFGCAFRSFLPRADVQRICLYDSFLSSVLVGRAVATVAELCFVAQMALHLRRLAERHHAAAAVAVSGLVVPLIVAAELFSWYAVLSTNFLGNAIEESLWTLSAALLLTGSAALWPRCDAQTRKLLTIPFIAAPIYLAFMTFVDVPMYLSRWRADEAAGRAYLPLMAGLRDLSTRWVVSRRWSDWSGERAWMTLYFSSAVWISIALATPSALARWVSGLWPEPMAEGYPPQVFGPSRNR